MHRQKTPMSLPAFWNDEADEWSIDGEADEFAVWLDVPETGKKPIRPHWFREYRFRQQRHHMSK